MRSGRETQRDLADWQTGCDAAPSDGWPSQIARTSGLRWGHFVKLWDPRPLDSGMRIAMSPRCRASIHARPRIGFWDLGTEHQQVKRAPSQQSARHSKGTTPNSAARTARLPGCQIARLLLQYAQYPAGGSRWGLWEFPGGLSRRLTSREDLDNKWFWPLMAGRTSGGHIRVRRLVLAGSYHSSRMTLWFAMSYSSAAVPTRTRHACLAGSRMLSALGSRLPQSRHARTVQRPAAPRERQRGRGKEGEREGGGAS